MNAVFLGLCGLGLLAVLLLRDAITDMCKEEVKTRLGALPYTLLRVVSLRFPRGERQDMICEWRAELDFILSETDGLPLTRLLRGIRYSVGLLGFMLPFAGTRELLAACWYRIRLRAPGRQMRVHALRMRVVVVGSELGVAELVSQLSREQSPLSIVAACVARRPVSTPEVAGVPVYGGLDDATAAARYFSADAVIALPCPEMDGVRLRSLAWELEKTGIDLCVPPELLDVAGLRAAIRPDAGLTLLHVDHPQLSGTRLAAKSLFDRTAAAAALIMLAPLLAILAVAIWLDDRGPILFKQVRLGKDGRLFSMYKFRTMAVDSEQRQAELLASNDHDGVIFKLRKDPRVTKIGASLRRWSLDELPNLFNVVFGDMSLVGPRPGLPNEVARYGDHVRRRLLVKPGLTGLWQVSGRSDLSWEEAVRLDLRYVENWSFALDLQILWKTSAVMLHGVGAY